VIELDNVGVVADGVPVFDGCTDIFDDGTTTVIDDDGSPGLTSLLRAIAGIEPHSGRIRIDGLDVRGSRSRLYVCFDDAPVVPYLSGHENVRLLSGRPVSTSTIAAIAPEIANDSLLRRRGRTLNLGERKRIHVVAALVSRASNLVFERPTSGPDAPTLDEVTFAVAHGSPAATLVVTVDATTIPEARVRLHQTQDPITS